MFVWSDIMPHINCKALRNSWSFAAGKLIQMQITIRTWFSTVVIQHKRDVEFLIFQRRTSLTPLLSTRMKINFFIIQKNVAENVK